LHTWKKLTESLFWVGEMEFIRRLSGVSSWIGTVAVNLKPIRSSWGGGNQWVQQMVRRLVAEGYRVCFDLNSDVDLIILVDPRSAGLVKFGIEEIRGYKEGHQDTICLHRINECDIRKNTYEMDELLRKANQVADFTVFISEWLLEYHGDRWFDRTKPHSVIHNGADPKIFYATGAADVLGGNPFRIVTHHWSDNWNKGFSTYRELDQLIVNGDLDDTEFWVIGRWPKDIRWQKAKTFGPTRGKSLAKLLRQCHLYVTASLWEPGGMHHIEGAQCGLPVIYHEDGGGIVELAKQYGIAFRDNVKQAVLEGRVKYHDLKRKVLLHRPSGDKMCSEYLDLIRDLIATK
jgi:glycosyltransferase involved in cell wall biosynthesis